MLRKSTEYFESAEDYYLKITADSIRDISKEARKALNVEIEKQRVKETIALHKYVVDRIQQESRKGKLYVVICEHEIYDIDYRLSDGVCKSLSKRGFNFHKFGGIKGIPDSSNFKISWE